MDEYEMQAKQFCRETGTRITIRKAGEVDRFPGDPEPTGWRNKYRVTIERRGERFNTPFYDSIANDQTNRRPTAYDVLACLQKYEVGDFWNFVAEFGYSTEGKANYTRAMRTFLAVSAEYENVARLFKGVISKLREIQ